MLVALETATGKKKIVKQEGCVFGSIYIRCGHPSRKGYYFCSDSVYPKHFICCCFAVSVSMFWRPYRALIDYKRQSWGTRGMVEIKAALIVKRKHKHAYVF